MRIKTGSLETHENKDGLQGEMALGGMTGEGVCAEAALGEVWAEVMLGMMYKPFDKCHSHG